jgi:hypothetical protein
MKRSWALLGSNLTRDNQIDNVPLHARPLAMSGGRFVSGVTSDLKARLFWRLLRRRRARTRELHLCSSRGRLSHASKKSNNSTAGAAVLAFALDKSKRGLWTAIHDQPEMGGCPCFILRGNQAPYRWR